MYLLRDSGLGTRDSGKGKSKGKGDGLCVQLMGSGTILREVIAAAELLEKDFGIKADIWSCPSFTELAREGQDVERWNRLNPAGEQRKAYVTSLLEGRSGSAITATVHILMLPDQIQQSVPQRLTGRGKERF